VNFVNTADPPTRWGLHLSILALLLLLCRAHGVAHPVHECAAASVADISLLPGVMLTQHGSSADDNACGTGDIQQETTRCKAITKKGTQCKRNAKEGKEYCWQHEKVPADERCKAITKKGTQCSRKAKSANGYCTQHAKILE
jgi:hypothetical protein